MKPTPEEMAAKTWQAVREAWAWLDREKFIKLDPLIDAVAARCGVDFSGMDPTMIYLARGGLQLYIKARAWLGPNVSAKQIIEWMDSGASCGEFSSDLQCRYLVERNGREGYVRIEDLTDAEKNTIKTWLRASAAELATQVKALTAWAKHDQPIRKIKS
jgi:hypothetical protein